MANDDKPGEGNAGAQDASGDAQAQSQEKLGGILFWVTGGLAIFKDLVIDTGADAIIAFGLGGSALTAGIGAVVGIPIAVLAWGVKMLFAVTIWLIMYVYFYLHGGIHASVRIKRFVIWFLAIIIEVIPGADLLPATTTMFFLVAFFENAVRKDNLLGFAARTAVSTYTSRKRPNSIGKPTLNKKDGRYEKLKKEYNAERDPEKRKKMYANWEKTSKRKSHKEYGARQEKQREESEAKHRKWGEEESPLAKSTEERRARFDKWNEERQKSREEDKWSRRREEMSMESFYREQGGKEAWDKKHADSKAEAEKFAREYRSLKASTESNNSNSPADEPPQQTKE